MRWLDGIAELIAPTRCAGCELPGTLLCPECRQKISSIDQAAACPKCGAPYGKLVCTECWRTEFSFAAGCAIGELDGPLARAVVVHKDAGERRLGEVLGRMAGETVRGRWGSWPTAITWVPPTDAALRRRGFDHGASIAHPAASVFGAPAIATLRRPRALDQRRLGRAGRLANAADAFEAVAPVSGNVLVIDDVMTTGATLDSAAAALLGAGACEVRAAVLARAW